MANSNEIRKTPLVQTPRVNDAFVSQPVKAPAAPAVKAPANRDSYVASTSNKLFSSGASRVLGALPSQSALPVKAGGIYATAPQHLERIFGDDELGFKTSLTRLEALLSEVRA